MTNDLLGKTLAADAVRLAVGEAEQIQQPLPADQRAELIEATRAATERLTTKDPAWRSWRLWGAFWAALTGALSLPEVQVAIHALVSAAVPVAYLPLATAILGTIWPVVSRVGDARPVRTH